MLTEPIDQADTLDAILAEAASHQHAKHRQRADDAAPKVLVRFASISTLSGAGMQWRPALLLGVYDDARCRVLLIDTTPRSTATVAAASVCLLDDAGRPSISPTLAQLQHEVQHAAAQAASAQERAQTTERGAQIVDFSHFMLTGAATQPLLCGAQA